MPDVNPLRLATAQVAVREDPGDSGQVRQSGHDVRELMRQARQAGARIIHFPEGATCSPHKRGHARTPPRIHRRHFAFSALDPCAGLARRWREPQAAGHSPGSVAGRILAQWFHVTSPRESRSVLVG
jgi:hypothetical protein